MKFIENYSILGGSGRAVLDNLCTRKKVHIDDAFRKILSGAYWDTAGEEVVFSLNSKEKGEAFNPNTLRLMQLSPASYDKVWDFLTYVFTRGGSLLSIKAWGHELNLAFAFDSDSDLVLFIEHEHEDGEEEEFHFHARPASRLTDDEVFIVIFE